MKQLIKKKNQDKLSEDNFEVGDIIMIKNYQTSRTVFKVIAFGRIRQFGKDNLVIKLILIPKRKDLIRLLYTVTYSQKKSKAMKKYWLVDKEDARILIKSNQSLARYDYKSLIVFTKLKFGKLIEDKLLIL